MTNLTQGQLAEARVAKHLGMLGYKIIDRNWKTPRCEIDIIATRDKVIYFIEVKYRQGAAQGTGFDYITNSKLAQMEFSARLWVSQNDWSGDYRLMAAEVSGSSGEIQIIEL